MLGAIGCCANEASESTEIPNLWKLPGLHYNNLLGNPVFAQPLKALDKPCMIPPKARRTRDGLLKALKSTLQNPEH